MEKERKKQLKAQWKQANRRCFELGREEAERLLRYVDGWIAECGCDNTLRFTRAWISENISFDRHERIYAEIEQMGGGCDCEVVYNCYEEYDIEIPEEE